MKRFFEWIGLKEKLDIGNHQPPLVKERDLWWISLGENVGSEINGKSKLFSRPGVILKKLSGTFYLIAPTTSQPRKGSWYVCIHYEEKEWYVCLHQIRTVDYRRLSSRIGQIDENNFQKVREGFAKLYQ